MHYMRWYSTGSVGEAEPRWVAGNDGPYMNAGYVLWYRTNANGERVLVREHREVMEAIVGRALLPGENVHHRNGVRDDNRPENLELWVTPPRSGQRVADLIAFVVAEYPDAVRSALDGQPVPRYLGGTA